jgi:HAD superfamily hydrolase (TIGR01458 family)
MKTIKGLLFDIGGVLYTGDTVIPGAIETIKLLKKDFPMRFVTNTTRRTPDTILTKLRNMGFPVEKEELFTALDATRNFVLAQHGSVYTILTDEAERYFDDLRSDKPEFVVVGDAWHNFDYAHLNEAFRHLHAGANLIAAAKNRYFKDEDGELSMDAGGFIVALEYAADTKAMLIGKPSRDFFHLAVKSMGLQPDEVLMVGDDIESDVKGAMDAGLRAALVKTGKFQPADLNRGIKPEVILPDITALPSLLM